MKSFNSHSVGVKEAASSILVLLVLLIGPLTTLAASPSAPNLGSSGNYVILAKTGISTTGTSSVVGDIGVTPAAATYITGFSLTLPAASAFSTSVLVAGKVYAPGYADPASANLTTAVLDMQTAYTDAAGRAADVTELGGGNIGGLTLAPGVYKWGTGVTIPTNVMLSGGANDVWIFQIAEGLSVSSGVNIVLEGGAQAKNIFWVVAGQTTIGTTAVFNGTILDQTAVVLNTGATLYGRALAQTAVTLDSNVVIMPASVAPTPLPTTSSTGSSQASSQTSQSITTGTVGQSTQTSTQASASSGVAAALQAQLNGLSATLQALQQAKQQGSSVPAASGQNIRTIAVNLGKGSRNSNVKILQQFLIYQNRGPAAQALANASATAYFGLLTRTALAEFQASMGISPALGNFGPITRAYISAHY